MLIGQPHNYSTDPKESQRRAQNTSPLTTCALDASLHSLRMWRPLPRLVRGPLACAAVLLCVASAARRPLFVRRAPVSPVAASVPAPPPTAPWPPGPPPTSVLYPGESLSAGQRLVSRNGGRAVVIVGSQLCDVADPSGGTAPQAPTRGCWITTHYSHCAIAEAIICTCKIRKG